MTRYYALYATFCLRLLRFVVPSRWELIAGRLPPGGFVSGGRPPLSASLRLEQSEATKDARG